eukprot:5392651-Prymnesium_polylepis.1
MTVCMRSGNNSDQHNYRRLRGDLPRSQHAQRPGGRARSVRRMYIDHTPHPCADPGQACGRLGTRAARPTQCRQNLSAFPDPDPTGTAFPLIRDPACR